MKKEEIIPLKKVSKEIEKIEEPVQTLSIFGSGDPKKAIVKAKEIADVVADVIKQRGLCVTINRKAYVFCEGWTTMGALLGVFPHTTAEDLSGLDEFINKPIIKYKAKCVVKTIDGKEMSCAEALCSDAETKWSGKDEHAIMSMAETRATGKALKLPLGWIMQLAGYEPTPAEEINRDQMIEEEVRDGDGEIDKKATEMEKTVPKTKGMTNKTHLIKQIEYLCGILRIGKAEFMKKVKEVESLGSQSEMDLAEIKVALWNKHKNGITIKKMK